MTCNARGLKIGHNSAEIWNEDTGWYQNNVAALLWFNEYVMEDAQGCWCRFFILARHHRVDVQLQKVPNSVNNQQPVSETSIFFIILAAEPPSAEFIWTYSDFVTSSSHTCTSSPDENNEAVWCATATGPNERSRLFRTHESSSVHLERERPLRRQDRGTAEVCRLRGGVQDLMMKATAAFVTLLTSGGRKEGQKRRIRGQNELAGAVNVGGCCTGAAGDHKRGKPAP